LKVGRGGILISPYAAVDSLLMSSRVFFLWNFGVNWKCGHNHFSDCLWCCAISSPGSVFYGWKSICFTYSLWI